MKTFVLSLVLTISLSINLDNAPALNFINPDSLTAEVEKLLDEATCGAEKDLTVTLFFSVSEDHKIQSLRVASKDLELNDLIQKKLENKKLSGESWRKDKIYELKVEHKA